MFYVFTLVDGNVANYSQVATRQEADQLAMKTVGESGQKCIVTRPLAVVEYEVGSRSVSMTKHGD